jgi:2-dehydro-3-deoxyphosphogluconate aldolase/(4S)-4-hydroxy-2-oxoglutarate aldolase
VQTTRYIAEARDAFVADGVVLCIRLENDVKLLESCRAAARGGLRTLELTLTTPGALRTIETLAQDSDLLVGAGTVLSVEDVRRSAEAGARFVLSPVFDPQVVDEARRRGLLAVPGASTATEILAAHRHGAPLVKLFPAGPLGGPAYLRALRGPLPGIPLVPTSGPCTGNLADYFDAGATAVGVGAEVFSPGFDETSIETVARSIRRAADAARIGAGRSRPGPTLVGNA